MSELFRRHPDFEEVFSHNTYSLWRSRYLTAPLGMWESAQSKIYIHLFFVKRRYKPAFPTKIKLRVQDGLTGFSVTGSLSYSNGMLTFMSGCTFLFGCTVILFPCAPTLISVVPISPHILFSCTQAIISVQAKHFVAPPLPLVLTPLVARLQDVLYP